MPTDPPSCCAVLTMAEATPASDEATPNVPVLIDGAIIVPEAERR